MTKKSCLDFETVEMSHNYSTFLSSNVAVKKEDLGAFTITCTIGLFQFTKAFCDLGTGINLIPYALFTYLG